MTNENRGGDEVMRPGGEAGQGNAQQDRGRGGSGRGLNPEDRNERPGEGAGRGNQAENAERQELRQRVRDGETLSPEEQARFDELGGPDKEDAAEIDA